MLGVEVDAEAEADTDADADADADTDAEAELEPTVELVELAVEKDGMNGAAEGLTPDPVPVPVPVPVPDIVFVGADAAPS